MEGGIMSHCRKASSTRSTVATRRRLRPRLEVLEDRITPTTFTPTTFLDDGTVNSLRGVLAQANNDAGTDTDTIQLAAGSYKLSITNSSGKHEEANAQGDLNITSSKHALVIQGATDAKGNPTTTIQQTVADRVFQILTTGFTVTFKDLVIEGGQAQDDGSAGAAAGSTDAEGGGILNDGGNIILSNVVLANNSADAGTGFAAKGGGIDAESGGSLTIQSSLLQADSAFGGAASTSSGGGGLAFGGGVCSLCPTTITRSTLSDNVVTGGNDNLNEDGDVGGEAFGGGVYAVGTLSITDSILSGNRLTGGAGDTFLGGDALGGGVYARLGTLTISDSVLSGNTLKGGGSSSGEGGSARGGGVYASAKVTISTSTLSGNTLIGANGNLSSNIVDGEDGGGEADGGGIFVSAQVTATIIASSLSSNTLTGGNGSITNSSAIVEGNVGGHAEGGGFFAEFNSKVTISASTLSGNTLTGGNGNFVSGTVEGSIGGSASGGSVYATKAIVTTTGSTLSGNNLTGGNAGGGDDTPGTAQGGGGYFAGGGTYKFVNSTIADNQATGGLGTPNVPVASGGGLFFGDTRTTATLTNVTVADNKAILPTGSTGDTLAGGIDNDRAAVTLVNTLVALNSAVLNIDYTGTVSNSSGHNLIGNAFGSSGFSAAHGDLVGSNDNPLDPNLGPLADNGGPTLTMALLPGSPAINAGDNSVLSVTGPFDQRGQGFARVAKGTIDIGAFEVQPPPPPSPPPPTPKPPPTLHTPPLLAFFDSLLRGVETVNGNGTETVIDRIFGIPLLVSLYDSAGNLVSVTLFGINITFLFA
jgi:hypothetical protein